MATTVETRRRVFAIAIAASLSQPSCVLLLDGATYRDAATADGGTRDNGADDVARVADALDRIDPIDGTAIDVPPRADRPTDSISTGEAASGEGGPTDATTCGATQILCSGVCVDADAGCSTCAVPCAPGFVCIDGTCSPPPGSSCPDPTEPGCSVVFIAGGTFAMGRESDPFNSAPIQTSITVSSFLLDATEVTVARFRRYWAAGHPAPMSIAYPGGTISYAGAVVQPLIGPSGGCNWSAAPGAIERHPINCVDWWTAQAFCAWDRGRLPTEAEFEYAALGRSVSGVSATRVFPWGNTPPASCTDRAHWNNCAGDDGALSRRVGSLPGTGGVYDLAGNLWEWIGDNFATYDSPMCWGGTPRTNPICIIPGGSVTVRGGSFNNPNANALMSASRYGDGSAAGDYNSLGFRCVHGS